VNYEIVELDPYSGNAAKVYSIIPDGLDETLFDIFVGKFKYSFKEEIKDILKSLYHIGNTTGPRSTFFSSSEYWYGDFVCTMFYLPDQNLQLYCMRLDMVAIILGGGRNNPKCGRSWYEDETLSIAANEMINYTNDILKRLNEGDLYWSEDRTELEGNLKNYNNEQF
jgi:hypothetical protein